MFMGLWGMAGLHQWDILGLYATIPIWEGRGDAIFSETMINEIRAEKYNGELCCDIASPYWRMKKYTSSEICIIMCERRAGKSEIDRRARRASDGSGVLGVAAVASCKTVIPAVAFGVGSVALWLDSELFGWLSRKITRECTNMCNQLHCTEVSDAVRITYTYRTKVFRAAKTQCYFVCEQTQVHN